MNLTNPIHFPGFGGLPVDEVAELGVDLDCRRRLGFKVQLLVLCGRSGVVVGREVDDSEGPSVR